MEGEGEVASLSLFARGPDKPSGEAKFAESVAYRRGDTLEWHIRDDGKLVSKNLTSGAMAVAVVEEAK